MYWRNYNKHQSKRHYSEKQNHKNKSVIKENDIQGPRDANLQLALALSASLRAAEEDEVIQEAEALKAAGLTVEANQRLGTLEQFGFASAVAPQPRSAQGLSLLYLTW